MNSGQTIPEDGNFNVGDLDFARSQGNAQDARKSSPSLFGSSNSDGLVVPEDGSDDMYVVDIDLTVTEVITRDVFTTLTNVFYNTIPVTLTEFLKTTRVSQTLQVTD